MMEDWQDDAAELILTVNRMNDLRVNQGTSGNASVRTFRDGEAGLLITPSGVKYEALEKDDIVFMPLAGRGDFFCPHDGRRPSSEWRFHFDILSARTDVGAIVHTHGQNVTALACLRKGIPSFHYMVAVAGGHDIRCSPYATFGTQELSDLALAALEDRKACLLGNHGMIACGETLEQALDLAVEVETLAGMYLKALSVGEPVLLGTAEMDAAIHQFRHGYGSAD